MPGCVRPCRRPAVRRRPRAPRDGHLDRRATWHRRRDREFDLDRSPRDVAAVTVVISRKSHPDAHRHPHAAVRAPGFRVAARRRRVEGVREQQSRPDGPRLRACGERVEVGGERPDLVERARRPATNCRARRTPRSRGACRARGSRPSGRDVRAAGADRARHVEHAEPAAGEDALLRHVDPRLSLQRRRGTATAG